MKNEISRKEVVVLASGRGSNFSQVLEKNDEEFCCHVKHLITDQRNTGAARIADQANVPTSCLEREKYANRATFDTALLDLLCELRPDLILTLGYLRILNCETVQTFPSQIINIHPSLLPAFPGLSAQQQAWEYGVKISGATTHFVTEDLDRGPIICQQAVPRHENDTIEGFTERILKAEHKILVQTIARFCQDAL